MNAEEFVRSVLRRHSQRHTISWRAGGTLTRLARELADEYGVVFYKRNGEWISKKEQR